MSDPNGVTRRKLETIRAIQARGYRILIRHRGGVEIWRKADPEKYWVCGSLEQADIVTRQWSQARRAA